MGQQQAQSQSIHNYPKSSNISTPSSSRKPPIVQCKPRKPIQCQGLLRLRTTPFKNSIQIQCQSELLFLQNVETSLRMLLENRLNTNKLFMVEDIQKLIESLTFTLALLQQKNITYKDISPENIFYDNGAFKLLPNELIEHSTYQKLKLQQDCYPSPQLLIGLKLNEEEIEDDDILQKCNVFTLGMVLLQVATLLPGGECYDLEGHQIYHQVLRERIFMVGEYYGEKVARIIANMVDYDFQERMTLKELSIWVNRELQLQRGGANNQENDQLANSMMISKVTEKHANNVNNSNNYEYRQQFCHNSSSSSNLLHNNNQQRRLSKNNSVYMKRQTQPEQPQQHKQERNKIYISDVSHHHGSHVNHGNSSEQISANNRIYTNNSSYSQAFHGRNQYVPERCVKPSEKMVYHQQQHQHHDGFGEGQKYEENKGELRHANPYCEEFKFSRDDRFQKENGKKISKEPVNPYRNYYPQPSQDSRQYQPQVHHHQPREKQPLKELNNQYYPKIQEVIYQKQQQQQQQLQMQAPSPKESLSESNTITKIKQQILRSRRMLNQFRREEAEK